MKVFTVIVVVLEPEDKYGDPREAGLPSSPTLDNDSDPVSVATKPKTRNSRPKVVIPKEPIDPRVTAFAESVARLSYGPRRLRRKFGRRGGRR